MDLLVLTATFAWLNMLCIGGGLAAVPEMERQAVGHGWVTSREFVDGYTLAQLTPGPNMLVAAFVGYRAQGLLGALLAAAGMFLPSAIVVAVIAQQWERLRGRRWPDAITRALAPLGLGLSVAGAFTLSRNAIHDWPSVVIALGAAVVLTRSWLPPFFVIVLGGAAGWLLVR